MCGDGGQPGRSHHVWWCYVMSSRPKVGSACSGQLRQPMCI